MAESKIFYLGCILMFLVLVEAKTPPGIANNPSHATCKDKSYKECHNLVHVCPKFCPDSCHVNCASCKPICGPGDDDPNSGSSSPPPSDSASSPDSPDNGGKGDDGEDGGKGNGKGKGKGDNNNGKGKGGKGGDDDPDSGSSSPPSDSAYSPDSPDNGGKGDNDDEHGGKGNGKGKGKGDNNNGKGKGGKGGDDHEDNAPSPSPLYPPTPSPSPSIPTPSSSPPSENSASRKIVKCKDKSYNQCYAQEHVCPNNCPTSCAVDCATCKPVCSCDYPGAVCQDPRFIGADGITFYFHGKKDKDFCLVTDPNLHVNAHFIGKRNDNMKRDFTWVESIGVLFDDHRLFVGARKTSVWDDSKDRLALSFDGEPIFLENIEGSSWISSTTPLITITKASSVNNVIIYIENKLKITAKVVPISKEESRVHNYDISNDDCFAHLDLGFKFYSLSQNVEGLLGKTYRNDYVSRVKMGVTMPVVGGDKEYKTSGLFATDCLASIFKGVQDKENSMKELASLNCASGINYETTGVVCKR